MQGEGVCVRWMEMLSSGDERVGFVLQFDG